MPQWKFERLKGRKGHGPFRLFCIIAACSLPLAAEDFKKDIVPLLDKYCSGCHDDAAKGGINIEALTADGKFWSEPATWEKVLNVVREGTMPPAKKAQPAAEERARISTWLAQTLDNPDLAKIPRDVGRTVVRRLSRIEFNNTVRDLLGTDSRPADKLPPDAGGGGGFDNNASTLFIPPVTMEKLVAVSAELAATAKPDRIFRIRPGAGKDDRTAARENIEWLGARAFRRPLTREENDGLTALYDAQRKTGATWDDATRQAVRALLISPSFLFRVEQDKPGPGPHRISDWELAVRLSYFLWSTMPDDALLAAAQSGKLHEPAALDAQIARMLGDPKVRDFAENFTSQWLRTKELATVRPSADKFPVFTAELREAMAREPVEFFHGLLHENRPLTDCISADYTFADAALGKFYGLPAPKNAGWQRVQLAGTPRGGVLTMAGILTLTSYPRRSSPVLRGKWIMDEILGTPPPPPPAMIKSLPTSDRARNGLTFRQQLEQHRSKTECAACHRTMDQLGFGLENFSPIGEWRTAIADGPVDAAGELPGGKKFTGPAELKTLLLERRDEFTRNLTGRMLSYALGRGVEQGDWLTVRQIARTVAQDGYKTRRLIREIVFSAPFQFRRGVSE